MGRSSVLSHGADRVGVLVDGRELLRPPVAPRGMTGDRMPSSRSSNPGGVVIGGLMPVIRARRERHRPAHVAVALPETGELRVASTPDGLATTGALVAI